MIFNKKTFIIKLAAVSIALTGVAVNAEKVKNVTEQAITGVSASIDKVSDKDDKSNSDEGKAELATQAGVSEETMAAKEKDSAGNKKDSTDGKAESGEEVEESDATTAAAVDAELEDEEKDKENIKLNLVYDRLGMAKVDTYLNVRKHPSETAKIVGKMTKFSGCNIYNIKKGWAKIVSGQVRGYVKAEFLYKDDAALERAIEVATLRANVKTLTLNVRFLPTTDSRIYDLISRGSDYDIKKLNITESWMDKFMSKHAKKKDIKLINKEEMYADLDNWACIHIDDELCFVCKEYIKTSYKVDRAVKIKAHKKKKSSKGSSSSSGGGGNQSIVDYAMQFLGNPYVWGGVSLTNGCDCSGFTMSLYAKYGVSLPHFAASQASCTRSVSAAEAQPGDLFFYGSGEISHVAMYIGNGQIIHASNSRTGIIISNAYYRTPVKIGRVG
ncbi:MAG: C40 family peptidase [Lachnospiraceae bacterium]|nr:C40 family peptidase [Lachnospiraceae bacterium]